MKHGSLFSGIGGIDLGFDRAGIKTVWQCEIDEKASEVLERRFPGVPNYHDVREVTNDGTIEAVDIISGGFPCQDVSVAGRRAGLAGERSGLWFEYQRIIDEFQPRWVVAENVPGLLSSNNGEDFATVIRALDERGYCVSWRVLDAQYFGVAQRRRRVFIVASLGNADSAKVLFESESLQGNSTKSGEEGEGASREIAKCLTTREGQRQNATDETLIPYNISAFNSNSMLSDNPHSGIQKINTTRTLDGNGGNPACNQGGSMIVDNPTIWQCNHASEVYRDCGEISPTLQARMGTGGNNVPLVGVRRLTPTECERLQGFPDSWTDNGQADTNRYKQLGNAVCVNVAEWIGKRIMEVEND